MSYLSENWVSWLFAFAMSALALLYRNIESKLKIEQKKNEAIAEGVTALLRENIVYNYNRYSDKGYMPIYAKESVKKIYSAYTNLGGNDVASGLYHKMLVMPESPDIDLKAERGNNL